MPNESKEKERGREGVKRKQRQMSRQRNSAVAQRHSQSVDWGDGGGGCCVDASALTLTMKVVTLADARRTGPNEPPAVAAAPVGFAYGCCNGRECLAV